MCSKYKAPWFYFNRWFPILYGQTFPTVWNDGINFNYERVYLEHKSQAGKIVLDLVVSQKVTEDPEKVVILLPGAAGCSASNYMQELSGACADAGINVVVFNHYAPAGETNCRVMNMCHN